MEFAERRLKLIALTKQQIADSLKADILIIQALSTMDDLTTQINGMAKRLREWHGYFLPELDYALSDNEHYVNFIAEKSYEELVEEYGDGMQAKVGVRDYAQVQSLAKLIQTLFAQKEELLNYLDRVMDTYMKNVKELAGITIAARLLAGAGSLKKLSRVPASTVQMLGAEKALFRHLKTGARTPKHGFIFNHPIVQAASRSKKTGKAARVLADKISICAKLDYFKGEFLAPEYREKLEKQWGIKQ